MDVAWEAAASSVHPDERAWLHGVVFGVQRLRGRLDHLLGLHLHRGVDSVPVPLLRVLRLGAYQLLEMGSVPVYAAVSQSASQARRVGGRKGAGLVNAVLRALADKGGGIERFPTLDRDPVAHLCTWGSHPRWLIERWVRRWGVDEARQIVEAGNRIPETFLRPIGVPVPEAQRRLLDAGIRAEPGPDGSGTLRLDPGSDLVEALRVAPAIVQDPAAASVVDFAFPGPDHRVVDLCAAPGGKGIALMGLGAQVVGADPSRHRLERMRDSMRRLGLPQRVVVARAEQAPFRPVDLVLVDAPCTGTGTLARHPDARWRLQPGDPAKLGRVQASILDGAAGAVRAGGRLVYATCTIEPEENDEAVGGFLERHPTFVRDGDPSTFRTVPGQMGTDGAYAARLRRVT